MSNPIGRQTLFACGQAAQTGPCGRSPSSFLIVCAAAQEIIENHEQQALNAAIEEVANRLITFLKGNRSVGARERLAYVEAINTVKGVLSVMLRHNRVGGFLAVPPSHTTERTQRTRRFPADCSAV
jgi:hypothetical protein